MSGSSSRARRDRSTASSKLCAGASDGLRFHRDLRDDDLVTLLNVSRRNNLAWAITGALAYHDRTFIQVLEGPETAVDALLARIARDARNTGLTIFDRSRTNNRSFGGWSMGWVGAKDLARTGGDPAILFLRNTPDLLVNAMLAAFRRAVRLDLSDGRSWSERER